MFTTSEPFEKSVPKDSPQAEGAEIDRAFRLNLELHSRRLVFRNRQMPCQARRYAAWRLFAS